MISHNTLKTTLKLCHGFVALSVKSVNASEPNDKFVSCGLIDFAFCWCLGSFSPFAVSLMAIISQMSRQVSRGSAGDYEAYEQAGVSRLSWRLTGR